jgi:hypothetical protein
MGCRNWANQNHREGREDTAWFRLIKTVKWKK